MGSNGAGWRFRGSRASHGIWRRLGDWRFTGAGQDGYYLLPRGRRGWSRGGAGWRPLGERGGRGCDCRLRGGERSRGKHDAKLGRLDPSIPPEEADTRKAESLAAESQGEQRRVKQQGEQQRKGESPAFIAHASTRRTQSRPVVQVRSRRPVIGLPRSRMPTDVAMARPEPATTASSMPVLRAKVCRDRSAVCTTPCP